MHMIDMSNGRANMAWAGETPWHGLGQELTPEAPIEVWMTEAGLDWEIKRAPVTFEVNGEKQAIPNRSALYRSDTGFYLSTMSNNCYNIHQPREILEFYRDLVDADGVFQLETAGCIDDGKKVWALAKHRKDIDVDGDIIKPYLMLATSCDGSLATTAMFTTVRVVCNNTLQWSIDADGQQAVKVGHRKQFNAVELKEQLGLIDEAVERNFAKEMEALCLQKISDERAREVIGEVYARRDRKTKQVVNERHVELTTEKVMAILKQGPGAQLATADGTAWGLVNAVTHFEDFHRRTNDTENATNQRFKSTTFGDGAARKAKVLELLAA